MGGRNLWTEAGSQKSLAGVSQTKLAGSERDLAGTCVDKLCGSIFVDGGLDEVLKCIKSVRENIPALVSSVCNANTSRLKAEQTIADSRREEAEILETMTGLRENVSRKKALHMRAKELEQLAKSIAREEPCEKLEKEISATEKKLEEMQEDLQLECQRGADLSRAVKELFSTFEEVKKAAEKFQANGNTKRQSSRRKAAKRHKFEDGEQTEQEANKRIKTEDGNRTSEAKKNNGKQTARKKKVFEDVVSNDGKKNGEDSKTAPMEIEKDNHKNHQADVKKEEKKAPAESKSNNGENEKEVRRRKKFEDVEKDEQKNCAASESAPDPMDTDKEKIAQPTEKKDTAKKEQRVEACDGAKKDQVNQENVNVGKKEDEPVKSKEDDAATNTIRKKFEDIVPNKDASAVAVKSEGEIDAKESANK